MEKQQKDESQYAQLGVDSGKTNVRDIFKPLIDNEYPDAFVNIIEAPYGQGKIAMTQHCDGDGSKMIARLIWYLETDESEIIGYALDDALAMNTSDVAAAGFTKGPWIITQILNIGMPADIKEVVMIELAKRWLRLREIYYNHGFKEISFLGGETADLPDQVRSAVFDMTISAYAEKKHLIQGNVQPGDKIWGYDSAGCASWEDEDNSGLMANGLTMARPNLLWKGYDKMYPTLKRDGKFHKGKFGIIERSKFLPNTTIGQALLSPTRQWPIVIRRIMDKLIRIDSLHLLHGISINTGGGATKIKHIGHGILYVKNMPEPAPIFKLIQHESKEKWEYMFKTFNCGVGIDIVGENHPSLDIIIQDVARECNIKAYGLGTCLHNPNKHENGQEKNDILLKTPYGDFRY